MKIFFFITGIFFLYNIIVFSQAQKEDPVKLLNLYDKKKFNSYMEKRGWKNEEPPFEDTLDGIYFLYKKKLAGGGITYLAIYPKKYMHYYRFFEDKKKYSKVLSYEEFLQMPKGKDSNEESIENEMYNIKTITFNDPAENRNQNVFYGKIPVKKPE